MIFINASNPSALRLNEILRIYGEASGQCINREKSSIYFSSNTPDSLKQVLKATLNIQVEAFNEKYLGLPTAVGRITSGMLITSAKGLEVKFKDGRKKC